MHTLSQIYKKLGMDDKAENMLIQLIEVSRESSGDSDTQTLATVSFYFVHLTRLLLLLLYRYKIFYF